MLALYLRLRNWIAEKEEGQDLIEYALLVVLIALVVIIAIPALSTAVSNTFTNASQKLTT